MFSAEWYAKSKSAMDAEAGHAGHVGGAEWGGNAIYPVIYPRPVFWTWETSGWF